MIHVLVLPPASACALRRVRGDNAQTPPSGHCVRSVGTRRAINSITGDTGWKSAYRFTDLPFNEPTELIWSQSSLLGCLLVVVVSMILLSLFFTFAMHATADT